MKKILLVLSAVLWSFGSLYATTCGAAQAAVEGVNTLVCSGTNDYSGIAGCGNTSYQGGQEALLTYTPTVSGVMTLDFNGSTWSGLFVFDGCPDTAACVGTPVTSSAATKTMNVTVVAGTTYYIMVDTWPTPNAPCVAAGNELTLTAPPTCPPPTGIVSDVLSPDSAVLSWTTGGATEWLVEFGVAGFTPGAGTLITGASIDTMIGLTADTDYEWYVRDYCAAGDSSAWVGPNAFTTLSTCPVPSALATTFVGGDSVELAWTTGGATEWILEYGIAGYAVGTGTSMATTSNPASITGLSSATSYDVYVRDYCGVGDSSLWVGPVTFSTLILPLACTVGGESILYIEDFETDVTTGPGGSGGTTGPWTQVRTTDPDWTWDGAGGTASSPTGPSGAHNGTGFVYLETSGTAQDADTLTSGTYDLSVASAPARLRFFYHMFGADIGTMTVETSDDGGATWNAGVSFVGQQQTSSADAWKEAVVDITYAAGSSDFQVRFIGDKNNSPTGINFFYGDMAIDFIRIEACVSCPAPTLAMVDAVGSDTAQISWTTGGSTDWIVQYGPAGFTPGTGTSIQTSMNPYVITGLTELTDYEYYVRDFCAAGDSSLWIGPIAFKTELTPLSCPAGTGAPFNIFETSFEDNPGCTGTGSTVDWNGYLGFTNTNTLGGTFNGANWRIDCGFATSTGWVDAGALDGNAYAHMETSNAGVGGDPVSDTLTTTDFDISTLTGAARVTANYLNGGSSTFIIERSTDAGVTWTNVLTDNGLGGNANPDLGEWTLVADDISALLGVATTVTYRFIGVATNNSGDIGLDLLVLESCVSCVPPTAISATVISADSAQLDFTPFGPATNVFVEYGIAGFTPGTGTMDTTSADSLILSGLTPASTYEYYIGSDCSGSTGDSSILDGPYTFITPCVTFIAPYFENFDASNSTPVCWDNSFGTEPWSFLTSGNTLPDYGVNDANDHTTGSGNYAFIDASTAIGTNELVSPMIDISGLNFPLVGFWILSNNINDGAQNTLELSYWDGAAWVLLSTYGANNPAWVEVTDTVPAGTPSPTQFKLVQVQSTTGVGSQFNNDLLVDDFFVIEAPTCPAPSDLATAGIGSDTAVFTWSENGSATLWDVEVVLAGTTPTGVPTAAGVTDTFYVATGLLDNTDYAYYVRSSCSAIDSSFWTGPFAFTTECATFVPTYTTGFNPLIPACWEQAGVGTPATGPSGFGTSNWGLRSTFYPAGAAGINLFSTGKEEWLISPNFDLSAGGWSVEVEVAVVEFFGAGPDPDGMSGTDDEVQLLYTEDGITWNVLTTYNDANEPSATGTTEFFEIPSTGASVRFAIWASEGLVNDLPDYDFLLNAFSIIPTPQNEIGVTDVSSPVAGCGVESTPVTITVENFAAADLFYVPVVVELTGDITDVFTVIIDTFPAFSTTTLTLDSINTLAGGTVTVNAFTNLANDEDTSNDTMMMDLTFGAIPAAPAFTNVMACEGDSLVLTTANVGQLNWFTSDTASTPVFVGDTLLWTATNDTSFYVSQQETFSDTLTIDMFDSFGDGWNGASLNVFVNGVPTAGSPYTIATGASQQETFFVNHNDLISFLYTSGQFPAEPAYNIVTSAGDIIFNDGGGFGGANTQPAGGFNQNIQLVGCPSELTFVEISVGQHTLDSITMAACDSMMIAGVNVTTSGSYTDSLTSMGGCDSIVVIDLTINNSSASTVDLKLCTGNTITLADGTVVTTGGVYTATVPNAAGCDSVITYNIVEGMSSSSTQNLTLCAGDSVTVGSSVYTMTGSYMDTLGNADGCDSVITTNVVVLPATDVTIGGVTTVCDNAGVIDLTLDPVGGTLAGSGVTGNSFDPAVAGIGAHTLTYTFTDGNGCDARASLDLEVVVCTGIDNIEGIETISIYPNPYVSTINVMFDDATSSELTIKLFDIAGRVILNETVNTTIGTNNITLEVPADVAAGVTMMQIERDGAIYSTSLIKK